MNPPSNRDRLEGFRSDERKLETGGGGGGGGEGEERAGGAGGRERKRWKPTKT